MQKLSHKKVLITGGSSGIGQAIALAYAREGAHIVFGFRHNQTAAQATVQQIAQYGSTAIAIAVDLGDAVATREFFQQALHALGHLDILINNAGIVTRHEEFAAISLADFEKIYAVNVRAPFLLMQDFIKHLKQQSSPGSIINISSMSATVISPGLAHYESAKAALNALTRSVASDVAPYGIRVNAIAPGLVATAMNQAQREADPTAWQARSSKIPLGKVGRPEDVAELAVFLAAAEANWLTGTIIPVDGGIGVISPFV